MTLYDVKIDQENAHRWSELEIQQSYSMLSDQFSDSDETSLGGMTDDETSILYSMESRIQPGLRQICEVPMDDEHLKYHKKENEQPVEDPEKMLINHQIRVVEKVEKITHKPEEAPKPRESPPKHEPKKSDKGGPSTRTKVIAAVLTVSLALTAVLVALLIRHTTNNNETQDQDSQSAIVGTITEAPLVVEILDMLSSAAPFGGSTGMPSPAPTSAPADAYSYILNHLSSFTQRGFLLDASRPQGRAFLQLVMDNNDNVTELSHTKIMQTFALLTLYFSTSPKTWESAFTWTGNTSDICSWEGVVSCFELETGEKVVDGIALPNVGLSGTIPADICLLDHLERFDVRYNQLSGILPQCLTASNSLKTVLISDNAFTGFLPDGILLVPTLEELDVSNNSFLGELDALITGMFIKNIYRYGETWRLRRLHLKNNLFTGPVPHFFGALQNLKGLTLHGNDLSGEVDEDLCARTRSELTELTADCREVACTCCTTCY